MNEQRVPINRLTWVRCAHGIRTFLTSERGGTAVVLFGLLMVFLLAINGLNVVNSYVGRDFMTAIEQRDRSAFVRQALLYLGVFGLSTVVAVVHRFTEERLGLQWREWMTRRLVTGYLADRAYYRLDSAGVLTNPDQRIADDVRVFTTTTLSFMLLLANGGLTVIAFSGVMLEISPLLFGVAVGYAALGTLLTVFLGRPLVWLNYSQLDKEAHFRADLIHIRENSESVALLHRERRFTARLSRHLGELTGNLRRIIAVNRNLGFFTTGYNYLIQIIPVLVVAPLFFRGQIEFGVITQSVMAFSHLLGAFSLIVTQFQSITSFAAVVARIDALQGAIAVAQSPAASQIEVREEQDGRIAFERLTLLAQGDGRVLVKDLSMSVPVGTRTLILGADETTRAALLRATAGIWAAGEGRIVRPPLDEILFVPERAYLPPGTLRELLVRTGREGEVPDEEILAALGVLGFEGVVARVGGLDAEHDWDDYFSLREQQLLSVCRLLLAAPRFAFLDRPGTALGAGRVDLVLRLLAERSITYVTLGRSFDSLDAYDAVLELGEGGAWNWKPLRGVEE